MLRDKDKKMQRKETNELGGSGRMIKKSGISFWSCLILSWNIEWFYSIFKRLSEPSG